MGWFKGHEPPSHPPTRSGEDAAIETAWRIHGAIEGWTGKVDAKASFALAIESGLLVAAGGFTKKGSIFSVLDSQLEMWLFALGVGMLLLAVVFAGSVVKPRLRRRSTKREYKEHFIYFGHLRHWKANELEDKLRTVDLLPVLSRQLVVTSDIAWRKHVYVQLSMWMALLGFASLAVCGYLTTWGLPSFLGS